MGPHVDHHFLTWAQIPSVKTHSGRPFAFAPPATDDTGRELTGYGSRDQSSWRSGPWSSLNYMLVTRDEGVAALLEGLTPAQHRAVTCSTATVCVVASAGAGKTRVLTRRIAYRVAVKDARADHVLAITFTRKAAGELRERLSGLGVGRQVTAGTFHALALSQLKRWWADRRSPEPVLLQSKARLLAELAEERPALRDVPLADLAGRIEWAKARMVAPSEYAQAATEAHRGLAVPAEAVAALYSRYEDEKRRRRLVDFDDLLARYVDALATDSRFCSAQRWRWQHVFVDEIQDVNPLQCRVMLELLGPAEDLFVVGDPNQAIYGWNGADPGFLADFPKRWPSAEVVRLDDNHRSSPQVVAAAAAALGRQGTSTLRSTRADGPLPTLVSYPSGDAEAAGVAAAVRRAAQGGLAWSDMALLVRTNAQVAGLCSALAAAQVPYRSVGPREEPPAGDPAAAWPGSLEPEGDDAEAVTVCTFHRSKGLEWPAVWICGLEAGLVPISHSSSPTALAEERRLLYVAMTRAEQYLHCSWARERRAPNGAALRRDPSPWTTAFASQCSGTGAGEPGAGEPGGDHTSARKARAPGYAGASTPSALAGFLASARGRLLDVEPSRAGRARAACLVAGPVDPLTAATAEGLRSWRQRLARASGVPPHVLLHDSALMAIAARRPSTPEELLAVPGLGPVKVSRYGEAVLEVVRNAGQDLLVGSGT